MKRWDVYRWTRETNTAELIGTVKGPHQPAARIVACKQWPDDGKAQPGYPCGRLIVREQGSTHGMPCKVVRHG